MATPSSSETSPSPALSFTLPATASEASTDDSAAIEQADREERRRKLLARTEFTKITRALRTTLAFAGFKATHNVAHVPLRSLEQDFAQQQLRSTDSPTSTFGPSRSSAQSHGNGAGLAPAPLPSSSLSPFAASASPFTLQTNDRKRKAPPGSAGLQHGLGSPSNYPQFTHTHPNPSIGGAAFRNSGKSLFASILALPPAKRARTIHNPEAPPVPAPPMPKASPRPREKKPTATGKKQKKRKTAKVLVSGGPMDASDPKHAHAKGAKGKAKEVDGTAAAAISSSTRSPRARGRVRRGSITSVTSGSTQHHVDGDGESGNANNFSDMRTAAAATALTDMFFSRGQGSPRSTTSASRMEGKGPSHTRTGSQLSVQQPLSPIAGGSVREDAGAVSRSATATPTSAHLVSQSQSQSQAQSRYSGPPQPTTSAGNIFAPSSQPSLQSSHTFSHPPPSSQTDSEAAGLMLLLANSPSPARPSPVTRSQERERGMYAAGRVLFPSAASMNAASVSAVSGSGSGKGSGLQRGLEGQGNSPFSSFTSTNAGWQESRERSRSGERRGLDDGLRTAPASPMPTERASASPASTQELDELASTGSRSRGSRSPLGSGSDYEGGKTRLLGAPLEPTSSKSRAPSTKGAAGGRRMAVEHPSDEKSSMETKTMVDVSPATAVTRPLSELQLRPIASISPPSSSSQHHSSATNTHQPSLSFSHPSPPPSQTMPQTKAMANSGAGGTPAWLRAAATPSVAAAGVGSPLRHSFDGE